MTPGRELSKVTKRVNSFVMLNAAVQLVCHRKKHDRKKMKIIKGRSVLRGLVAWRLGCVEEKKELPKHICWLVLARLRVKWAGRAGWVN